MTSKRISFISLRACALAGALVFSAQAYGGGASAQNSAAPKAQAVYILEVEPMAGAARSGGSAQRLIVVNGSIAPLDIIESTSYASGVVETGLRGRVELNSWTPHSALASMTVSLIELRGNQAPAGDVAELPQTMESAVLRRPIDLTVGQRVKIIASSRQSVYVTLQSITAD